MTIHIKEDEYDIMETYALVGVTLHELQCLESILRFCMCCIFGDHGGNTLENLQNPKTRKKTIGQFLTRLREKSEIDPMFDTLLNNFLEHRNELVHNLTDNKLNRFDTKSGRYHIRVFIKLLGSEIDTISRALIGFLMLWVDPDKYSNLSQVKVRFKEGTLMGDAEQIFAPHSKKLIRHRRPN